MTHIDPSWCARINAHRHSTPEPSAPSAQPSAPVEGVPSPPASGSPFRLREVPTEHVCECCGTVMFDHNCKIICPNCGYKRDCSDP